MNIKRFFCLFFLGLCLTLIVSCANGSKDIHSSPSLSPTSTLSKTDDTSSESDTRIDFKLPDVGVPGDREAAATRGCPSLTALIPATNIGLTFSLRPTFWFYIQGSVENPQNLQFTLFNQNKEQFYQTKGKDLPISNLIRFELPANQALERNQQYSWELTYTCPTTSDLLKVDGSIQTVALSAELERQLNTYQESSLELIAFYAQQGLWHDTLTELTKLYLENPEEYGKQWYELLKYVNAKNLELETTSEQSFSPLPSPQTNEAISNITTSNNINCKFVRSSTQKGEAARMNDEAMTLYSQGKITEALEKFQESLKIYSELGDCVSQANILSNIAIVHRQIGKYPQALQYYNEALTYQKASGQTNDGIILNNIATIYGYLGQTEKAIQLSQEVLNGSTVSTNIELHGTVFSNISMFYRHLGQHEKALEYSQQALSVLPQSLLQTPSIRSKQARAFNAMGLAYDRLGQYNQAIQAFEQGLKIALSVDDKLTQGTTLINMGESYDHQGQYKTALQTLKQAVSITKENKSKPDLGQALHQLALVYSHLKQYSDAETTFFQTIDIWDSLRAEDLQDTDRVSLFETQLETYSLLQEVLITQNKTSMALEVAEAGRARALMQLLADKTFTPIKAPKIKQIQKIAQTQNATLVEYSLVGDKLYIWVVKPKGKERIIFKQTPITLNLSELIQNTRNAILTKDLAVIQTFSEVSSPSCPQEGMAVRLVDDGSDWEEAWKVISVDCDQQTMMVRLPSMGIAISKPISKIVAIASEPTYKDLQTFYQLLIDPIVDHLPTQPEAKVIFIPQGVLFGVPFPALQDQNGTYLIEKQTILTAPAIQLFESTQKLSQRQSNRKDNLIVGNPTISPDLKLSSLPYSEKEAEAIAQLLKTQPLLGEKATKDVIVKKMPQAKMIHFATHSLRDEQQGLNSSIILASGNGDNGKLTAEEILPMNLAADLVVLSACDTARGKITGDGVIGLSRSFVAAGVKSVVVSLWLVPDTTTAELMTEFHQLLLSNKDKAESLRKAMVTTMKQHPNPKDWAAFTLIGESN